MPGKDLRQAATSFAQQLEARVRSLIDAVTSLEVSTYAVDASQFERVDVSADVPGLVASGAAWVRRQGYTRVTFQCDLNGCVESGREEAVDAAVRPMHSATVEQALAGREKLLNTVREIIPN